AADGGRRVVTDAESTAVAVVAIVLVVVQQPALPLARELMTRHDRPVVVLNLAAELGDHARYAYRARIPTIASVVDLAFANRLVRLGHLRAASGAAARRVTRALPADLFDQRRQRGFGVGRDREVDVSVVAVVVDVVTLRQVLRADADGLAARGARLPQR